LSRRLPYAKVVQGRGKAKRKAENFIVERKHTDKLQFIGLIGGWVCNPRQQHVVDIQSILLLPR
uniref:hypothetical protein n=1 Tax=Alloprevotella sp. TaxID=1872471 RepID=UPI00402A511B